MPMLSELIERIRAIKLRLPCSTLFPYTTLFRSGREALLSLTLGPAAATTPVAHDGRRHPAPDPRLSRPATPYAVAPAAGSGKAEPPADGGASVPVFRGFPDLADRERRLGRLPRAGHRPPHAGLRPPDLHRRHPRPGAL